MWNLALVLEQQNERNWAEKLYAKIPEDAPEWCDACFRLGYLRLLRGDYAASAAELPGVPGQAAGMARSVSERRHRVRAVAASRNRPSAASRRPW